MEAIMAARSKNVTETTVFTDPQHDDTTPEQETPTPEATPVVTESTEAVSQADTRTEVTAYGFTKIVNKALEEAGLKVIPPQMIYSYKAKGLLGTEEKPLTAEYAVIWTAKYIERKAERATKAAEKIEAELKGETTHTVDTVEPDVSTETETIDA
jgi:hypothetical protein